MEWHAQRTTIHKLHNRQDSHVAYIKYQDNPNPAVRFFDITSAILNHILSTKVHEIIDSKIILAGENI